MPHKIAVEVARDGAALESLIEEAGLSEAEAMAVWDAWAKSGLRRAVVLIKQHQERPAPAVPRLARPVVSCWPAPARS